MLSILSLTESNLYKKIQKESGTLYCQGSAFFFVDALMLNLSTSL